MNNENLIKEPVISDQEIVSRILTGEKELYALLIQRYNRRLYRVGMSILNDDPEVEDVMQVTYIKAYENLGRFEFKSAFSTWLTRILINECLLRKKKRKNYIEINDQLSNNIPGNFQNPQMKLMNSELKVILEKAISELPEIYRSVFFMREIENMSVFETGECLGITESNVKVRFNRAKQMLQNSISTYFRKEELFSFHLSRCERVTEKVMRCIGNSSSSF